MVHVETVDLSARDVRFPSDRVGMVIAQLHLPDASLTPAEPFHCTDAARPGQLAAITATLDVARAAPHGAAKTHFTLFPEYGIPGFDGIALVEAALGAPDWPNGTVVIGGTDALTRDQYLELLQGPATHVDQARNGVDRVAADQWVNCAITWVKDANGSIERWIQPKLHPAREEAHILHQHMFRGSSVFLFNGLLENQAPYRFGTLVCFDWIATIEAQTPCQWVLAHLQQEAGQHQLPLSWLFVVQRNKRPSHDTFLSGVATFFNQTQFPNALRERACLVFANTAGDKGPGPAREFGALSIVLSPHSLFAQPTCGVPTVSTGGPRFRDGSALLHNYKDVFFRERGACIHSFAQINPGSLLPGPPGRVLAVENAHVFPVSGQPEPRAPRGAVSASVKWLNDELDSAAMLADLYPLVPLAPAARTAHEHSVAALRLVPSQRTTQAMRLAAQDSGSDDADKWDFGEAQALEHLVHTLDILGVAFPSPTVGGTPAHATVLINNATVDLLVIRGPSHELCIEHSKLFPANPQRQVLLVSRDPDNTPWSKRLGSILQPTVAHLGGEAKITDPASGSLHLGYQNLLALYRDSSTAAQLAGGISAELAG